MHVMAQAHQFQVVKSDTMIQHIDLCKKEIKSLSFIADGSSDDGDDHALAAIKKAIIIMIAADELAAELIIDRASKSKALTTHLNRLNASNTKTNLEALADALSQKSVREVVEREVGIDPAAIDEMISSLRLTKTRRYMQIYGGRALPVASIVEKPPAKKRGRPRKDRSAEAMLSPAPAPAPALTASRPDYLGPVCEIQAPDAYARRAAVMGVVDSLRSQKPSSRNIPDDDVEFQKLLDAFD